MNAMGWLLKERPQCFKDVDINRLVKMSHHLCDWPFLFRFYQQGLWSVPAERIALLEGQMGFFDAALNRMRREPLPKGNKVAQFIWEIQQTVPYPEVDLIEERLSLTPLQYHHVTDFCWQYADKKIARLCNLPVFTSSEEWLSWLHVCQQEKERKLLRLLMMNTVL